MSQLRIRKVLGLIFLALLIIIGGCSSSKNENSPFSGGSHPSGWLPAGHMTSAQTNIDACVECHGSDLGGGISHVSCTSCHLGSAMWVHPLDGSGAILTTHGPYVAANTTSGCATETCHGTSLSGVSGSGPSCTSCHIGGVISGHPIDWGSAILTKHGTYVATSGTSGCATANCHGTSLSGVPGSGPGCQSCHQNGVYPFTATGCTSCHGNPPSGIEPPNQAGAHNTVTGHFAAQVSLPDGCATCHVGQGAGSANHFNGVVDVQLLTSVYSANGSTAMYNYDGTCSNVSCHGGIITPNWNTGTIDVNNGCTACHTYGTQYNGYISGKHGSHINEQYIYCTECHDTDKLIVNHFTTLNTMVMEGPAADTIADNVHYSGSSCTPSCHAQRDWLP